MENIKFETETGFEFVANSLGLKLYEKFMIKECRFFYVFTAGGFYSVEIDDIGRETRISSPQMLYKILEDPSIIRRKRWKPTEGEKYYSLRGDIPTELTWNGTVSDLLSWKAGNCFENYGDCLVDGFALIGTINEEFKEYDEYE